MNSHDNKIIYSGTMSKSIYHMQLLLLLKQKWFLFTLYIILTSFFIPAALVVESFFYNLKKDIKMLGSQEFDV